MKLGRFIIDGHVHAQRHAAGPELKKELASQVEKRMKYSDLAKIMPKLETYDNSKRLLYDMETYGVDMCVITPAFGMSNKLNLDLVDKYPGRFAALCTPKETYEKADRGEIEWTIEQAVDELDALLATGKFVGIGEGFPADPLVVRRKKRKSQNERIDEMLKVLAVAKKYGVPVHFHTSFAMGYHVGITEGFDPLWAHDLASEFPDVPIIFDHGGMANWWWEHFVDQCLHVAASHENVYLETGLYWTDLYHKPLLDPNIGAEKLIWGTDWGASIPIHTQIGQKPGTYAMQILKEGIVKHQVDIMGWSLKQISRLDISQDDMNLILGGNAARVYKIKPPFTRMFREVG
jgi:predicted TIM-barrel fold metal-dependent hydrolase